jgi:hypothetical protein
MGKFTLISLIQGEIHSASVLKIGMMGVFTDLVYEKVLIRIVGIL